jgi:hypothetical protein
MASPPESRQPRRHSIRGDDGKFAPPQSPHHQVVQSTYQRTQLSRAPGFTPHQGATITPQDGSR